MDDKTLTGCKPVDSGEIPSKLTSFRSRLEETSFGLVQVIFKGETNKKSEIEEKSGGHDLRTEFKPDFLDADEMAPGSKTAPAKPEVANDFTGY